jgi:GNAT superfamily N-acetyltransferase
MRLGQIGVRRAKDQDVAAIAQVHDEAWRLAYRGVIPGRDLERMVERRGASWWRNAIRRQAVVLVMEIGGTVVGYATLGPTRMKALPYAGEIYEIYLKPEYQGLGFGRHLFAAARAELVRYGMRSFAVRVLKANAPAGQFYQRLGGTLVADTAERIGESVLPVTVFGWAA